MIEIILKSKQYRMMMAVVRLINIFIISFIVLFISCKKELRYKQVITPSSFDKADSLTYTTLGDNLHGVLKGNNKKDILVFINDNSKSKEDIIRYFEFYNFMGFDVLLYNYSNSNESSSIEMINDHFNILIKNLIIKGYKKDRIVVFGSNETSVIALAIANFQNVRGCIIENPASEIKSDILNFLPELKSSILILQGENSLVSNIHTTVNYYIKVPNTVKKQIVILSGISDDDMFYDDEYLKQVIGFYPTSNGINKNYPNIKW